MTTRTRAPLAVTAMLLLIVFAVVARGRTDHKRGDAAVAPVDRTSLNSLVHEFVAAVLDRPHQAVTLQRLAMPALARDLTNQTTRSCDSVQMVDVSLSATSPPSAYVIAQCHQPRDTHGLAIAWSLHFAATPAGWRVAAVTP